MKSFGGGCGLQSVRHTPKKGALAMDKTEASLTGDLHQNLHGQSSTESSASDSL